MDTHKQKCTFKGCTNEGVPQEGFDFYVCDKCFEEFDVELARAAMAYGPRPTVAEFDLLAWQVWWRIWGLKETPVFIDPRGWSRHLNSDMN